MPNFDKASDSISSAKRQKTGEEEEEKGSSDVQVLENFDPDEDGFYIGKEDARTLHFRIRTLYYIRRVLVKEKNYQKLNESIKDLGKNWKKDMELIDHLNENGFDFSKKKFDETEALERAKQICEIVYEA